MRHSIQHLILLALLIQLASCVTSRVEIAVEDTLTRHDGDGVVLLVRRDKATSETEGVFLDCVKKQLDNGKNGLQMVDENVFLDSLFPYFEPRVAPLKVDALPDLLGKPNVAEKVAQAGVRYIMWLDGSVETLDGGGSLSCDISVGCFGFAWWENGATYEASIWDLENFEKSGIVSTNVTGRSFLPAIVVPIPLIAKTKTTACHQLADNLKKQFDLQN